MSEATRLPEHRIGYILISKHIAWNDPISMKAILQHFIPVQIVPEWELYGELFRYVGLCDDFDLIAENSHIPQYEVKLYHPTENAIVVRFTKI